MNTAYGLTLRCLHQRRIKQISQPECQRGVAWYDETRIQPFVTDVCCHDRPINIEADLHYTPTKWTPQHSAHHLLCLKGVFINYEGHTRLWRVSDGGPSPLAKWKAQCGQQLVPVEYGHNALWWQSHFKIDRLWSDMFHHMAAIGMSECTDHHMTTKSCLLRMQPTGQNINRQCSKLLWPKISDFCRWRESENPILVCLHPRR